MTVKKERPVLVTTEHKGVFFGFASKTDGEVINLRRAQLVIYWSSDLRGFMGLASHGPNSSCKIGRPADIQLRAITAIVECSEEAVAKFEKFAKE